MSLFPDSPRATLYSWTAAHAPIWAEHAQAIGVTQAQVALLQQLLISAQSDAQASVDAQQAAQNAAQVAAASQAALRTLVSAYIGLIRANSNMSGDLAIYDMASLPRPRSAVPIPAPAMPRNVSMSLEPTSGAVTLTWKATQPKHAEGTSYIVRRKLPGQAAFEFIGITGKKRFVDVTLTSGHASVQYTVQAQRAGQSGPVSNALEVNFGRAQVQLSDKSPKTSGYRPQAQAA
jgi:hypothetical protein